MNKIITVFSDWHVSSNTKNDEFKLLTKAICKQHSNYTFFIGDLLDASNIPIIASNKRILLLNFIKAIVQEKPLIIIRGNHDTLSQDKNGKWVKYICEDFWQELASIHNVHLLFDNNLTFQDENLHVVGLELKEEYYENEQKKEDIYSLYNQIERQKETLKKLPKDKLKILLVHSPILITNKIVAEHLNEFDVILSGHVHGGLVPPILERIWPKNKGIKSPISGFFPNNARGIKTLEIGSHQVKLFISSGITKLSQSSGLQLFNFLFPREAYDLTFDKDNNLTNINKILIKKSNLY